MTPQPRQDMTPELRQIDAVLLAGTMVIYENQQDATERIPSQWADLMSRPVPELHTATELFGASPCTADGKLHYFAGIQVPTYGGVNAPARITLEAGEYAIFTVPDISRLRDTWIWALTQWLPHSGRRERNAPQFERYVAPYNPQRASGPVEIGIPLEPIA